MEVIAFDKRGPRMKPAMTVGLATWMLEHLTFGRDNESLSGDLLEELRAGRSAGWYFRQVSMAIGIGVCEAIREYASSLLFSAGWSTLYPLWRFIGRNWLVHPEPGRRVALGWPYSTMLDLADGILPAVTFVWLGLLVYLLLLMRLRRAKELSSFRVLLGLSTSLSVLLVATIGLFYYLKHPVMNVQYVATEGFYSLFHICAINIPLTLSLLVALLSTLPRTPCIARKRRTPHTIYEHGTGSNSIL
jgi:hypothetical protein